MEAVTASPTLSVESLNRENTDLKLSAPARSLAVTLAALPSISEIPFLDSDHSVHSVDERLPVLSNHKSLTTHNYVFRL